MSKVGRGRKSTIYLTKAQRRKKKSASFRKSVVGMSLPESDLGDVATDVDSISEQGAVETTGSETQERTGRRRLKRLHCNDILAKGLSLGKFNFTVTVPGVSGATTTFKCTKDCLGGRGLRVVHAVKANVVIARGFGTLVHSSDMSDTSNYKVWDSKSSYLLLHTASVEYPCQKTSCTRIINRILSMAALIETCAPTIV